MRRKWVYVALGGVIVVPLLAAPFILAPGPVAAGAPAAVAVGAVEQAALIEAMRPVRRGRPVIALVANNQGTEVADFLVAYGVLRHADVADVTVVAQDSSPVQLYPPKISIVPQTTLAAFDQRYPNGADYVVVPAMEPPDGAGLTRWVSEQYRKGAHVVSICNGSRTLAAAGLLDGRRATAHWYSKRALREEHPTMRWVSDRRYVTDGRITTSTGVTANVPVMMALVEAIGGRETATRVAHELGVAHWDARHRSSAFVLTAEHKKTFIRNTLAFWQHETVGVPLQAGVDEVALGLTLDAYGRTALGKTVAVGVDDGAVRSRHGLTIQPARTDSGKVDYLLPPPSDKAPASVMAGLLPDIQARYGPHTAGIVALTMEYPWQRSASMMQ
ncbi:DJ-1/PfpI family protein [Paracandidimonas lactea]|uniref:DJ-1/PfpI family protein n=1 Tax=Paracandidimonas lactea TaxID=2895524 RepID=UPI001F214D04|nr:DJ-1/PfpI family protein [Paracandidimonas lactea]